MAAQLLLAAGGREAFATDEEEARAVAGATLVAEAIRDLRLMREGPQT